MAFTKFAVLSTLAAAASALPAAESTLDLSAIEAAGNNFLKCVSECLDDSTKCTKCFVLPNPTEQQVKETMDCFEGCRGLGDVLQQVQCNLDCEKSFINTGNPGANTVNGGEGTTTGGQEGGEGGNVTGGEGSTGGNASGSGSGSTDGSVTGPDGENKTDENGENVEVNSENAGVLTVPGGISLIAAVLSAVVL
jgi:hypothetical protein